MYPKLKEVDDVLGGAAAWENVDHTDGQFHNHTNTAWMSVGSDEEHDHVIFCVQNGWVFRKTPESYRLYKHKSVYTVYLCDWSGGRSLWPANFVLNKAPLY